MGIIFSHPLRQMDVNLPTTTWFILLLNNVVLWLLFLSIHSRLLPVDACLSIWTAAGDIMLIGKWDTAICQLGTSRKGNINWPGLRSSVRHCVCARVCNLGTIFKHMLPKAFCHLQRVMLHNDSSRRLNGLTCSALSVPHHLCPIPASVLNPIHPHKQTRVRTWAATPAAWSSPTHTP